MIRLLLFIILALNPPAADPQSGRLERVLPVEPVETVQPTRAEVRNVDDLLDAVSQADAAIESLTGFLRYEQVHGLLEDRQVRRGDIALRILPDRVRQFHVHFTEVFADDTREEQSRHYIFDGRHLVERLDDEKQIIKRQVVRPGEEFDPLAVDGPFPLPIGQSRESILRRFTAKLLDPEAEIEHLRGFHRLHLTVRDPEDDLEEVDLWYDPATFLPHRARMVQRGGNLAIVDLARIEINGEVDADRFSTRIPDLGPGWRVDVRDLERP